MLSKTTTNYATKRGLDITNIVDVHCLLNNPNQVWIWELDNDNEPLLSYTSNSDGSFNFNYNTYLPIEIKEELPAYLKDEKALRLMLNFISLELNK